MQITSRDLEGELVQMAASYPVVTLLEPRQSGKTTLVKKVFPTKPYVTLEDPDERSLADSDPRGFYSGFRKARYWMKFNVSLNCCRFYKASLIGRKQKAYSY